MSSNHSAKSLLALGVVALVMTGCGANRTMMPTAVRTVVASDVESKSVPPQTAFQTVECKVTKILPDDTSGLPHQNFYVVVTDGKDKGMNLMVNNDTQYGSKVEGLAIGDQIEIKGVEYHDSPSKNGIHWTHHASKMNDAGYIKGADGHIYQ